MINYTFLAWVANRKISKRCLLRSTSNNQILGTSCRLYDGDCARFNELQLQELNLCFIHFTGQTQRLHLFRFKNIQDNATTQQLNANTAASNAPIPAMGRGRGHHGLACSNLADKRKDVAMRKRCKDLVSVNTSILSIAFDMLTF